MTKLAFLLGEENESMIIKMDTVRFIVFITALASIIKIIA